MMISSIQLRPAIIAMIDSSNSRWKFCEYLPKRTSQKWNDHDGVIVLVLSGVHFSVVAMKKILLQVLLNMYICVMKGDSYQVNIVLILLLWKELILHP